MGSTKLHPSNMSTIIVKSMFGDIEVFEDDLITDQIRRFGNHTRPEFAFALSVLDPEMKVFDLGAHIGTFSLAAIQKLAKTSRLLAVEGNSKAYALLERNCSGRGSTQMTFLRSFVGQTRGYSYHHVHRNTGAGYLAPSDEAGHEDLPLVTLDQLCLGYFPPDYIKIDIEGAEYEVLSGSDFIETQRPILYIEVSEGQLSRFGHSQQMLSDFLKSLGYEFFVNAGDRNGGHDVFNVSRIDSLSGYKKLFDALCVPEGSDELIELTAASSIDVP